VGNLRRGAETISKGLKVAVVSIPAEKAGEHFGWRNAYFGSRGYRTSTTCDPRQFLVYPNLEQPELAAKVPAYFSLTDRRGNLSLGGGEGDRNLIVWERPLAGS